MKKEKVLDPTLSRQKDKLVQKGIRIEKSFELLKEKLPIDKLPLPKDFTVRGTPRIEKVSPLKVMPGKKITIKGYNLKDAQVMLAGRPIITEKSEKRKLLARLPENFPAVKKADIMVWNHYGFDLLKKKIKVLPSPANDWFTFSNPLNNIVTPSGVNQKYLVLMVLPADQSLPAGLTEADMHADMVSKLDGTGKSVNGFWKESSADKLSFVFDVYNQVIDLDDDWFDYYHAATPKRYDAAGATFPITWTSGKTLQLSGASGFSVTVNFIAGTHTLADLIQMINDAIDLAYSGPGEPPIVARNNGGQLRIETTGEGSGSVLSIDGGTAMTDLGLDAAIMTPGIDRVDRRYDVFVEAMEKRTDSMTEPDARAYLAQFGGIIVSHAVSDNLPYYRANASSNGTFNVRGGSFQMGNVYITNGYPWQVFAHEIGHTIGFPDLYDEPGPPELVGVELGRWDIMAGGWHDAHPTTWTKSVKSYRAGSTEPGYTEPWLPATQMETIVAPPPLTTEETEIILLATNTEWPAINPFAASHPGLPIAKGVKIALDSGHNLFVEAREFGPYSHTTLGSAEYDSEIPQEGVIVIDAINDMTGLPVYRAYVTLLTPYGDAIDTAGEKIVEATSVTNEIHVTCEEVIGSDPTAYRIKVKWGPGSFFDLRIRPWTPPPWESADIWVDNQIDNDWDEYLNSDFSLNPGVAGNPILNGDRSKVGWTNRVYARVWNDGDTDASNVEVDFHIVVPAGSGPGVYIGSDTIANIPAGSFGLAKIDWTPRTDGEGHVCIEATVKHQTGELNASNNVAQENITDWYLEGDSPYAPVAFPFQVENPLPYRTQVRLEARGLQPGYHLDVKPVEFWLEAGEVKKGDAKLWAEDWTPYEHEDRQEKMPTPMVTLEWQVLHRCEWVPFGGISGRVHTVKRGHLDVGIEKIQNKQVMVFASATTKLGPIKGANVTMRLRGPSDKIISVNHVKTDNGGVAQFLFDLPKGYRADKEFMIEFLLSPTPGTGPAEKREKFTFG